MSAKKAYKWFKQASTKCQRDNSHLRSIEKQIERELWRLGTMLVKKGHNMVK